MASFEQYANKYQTARMERRNGILQMTLHTDGGPLLLSACHAQMPPARPWPVHLEARPILRRLPPRLPPSLVVNFSS